MSNPMQSTIKVRYKELDDPEKADKFRELFGKSKYIKALQQISNQVYGDGTLEQLESIAAKADDETYEKLRPKIQKEMNRLKTKDEAYAEVTLSWMDEEHIPERKRTLFKEYLGEERYYQAMGLDGKEFANTKTLIEINQSKNVRSYESRKMEKAQKKIEAEKRKQREQKQVKEEAEKILNED